MNTAYLLFALLHWPPDKYYNMSRNARAITRAFLQRMISDKNEEIEKMKG